MDRAHRHRTHGIRKRKDDAEDHDELQHRGEPAEALDNTPSDAEVAEGVGAAAGAVAVEVGPQARKVDGAVGASVAGARGSEAVGRGVLDRVVPLGDGDGDDAAEGAGDGEAESPGVGVEEEGA